MIKLSTTQKIKMLWDGYVYVGHETRPGWSGTLPFFVFKCRVHGMVKDYPHGYDERLECPHCVRELGESLRLNK